MGRGHGLATVGVGVMLAGVLSVVGDPVSSPAAPFQTFRNSNKGSSDCLTTSTGAPVEVSDTVSVNADLLRNSFFMETITRMNRERIPLRVVHTSGAGAFGYFQVTHNISHICKAKVFNEDGKKTQVAVRFSATISDSKTADTKRNAKGFAVKFYTEEGNFDLAMLSFPVFPIKDPLHFPIFINSLRNNPKSNLEDPNMLWDMVTLYPQTLFFILFFFSDNGTPYGYHFIRGFSIHTYQIYNDQGISHFVRFHFKPDNGIKNLKSSEAVRLAGVDPSYATRDLYNAIVTKNFPTWTASVQILTEQQVRDASFDVFDPTKTLPENIYPLREFGKLVLNRNQENYFSDIELLAFCLGNLIPGVLGAPDNLFGARILAYRDAQYYRLGVNFNNIPVNMPNVEPMVNYRDGHPPTYAMIRTSNYSNSFNGPQACYRDIKPQLIHIHQNEKADNMDQAGDWFRQLTTNEKISTVDNIVQSLAQAKKVFQERAVKLFRKIDHNLSLEIARKLKNCC